MYQGFVVASRAIVSTIGKVRSIFQQTNSLNKLLFRENYSHIVLYTEDGPVTYYPEKNGIPHEYWKEITHNKNGVIAGTIQNIFHKRDHDGKSKSYRVEQEYRFAMILGLYRFFDIDTNIAMDAEEVILRDYPIILRNGIHYIEKVYLRTSDPVVKADVQLACWLTGVKFSTEKIIAPA